MEHHSPNHSPCTSSEASQARFEIGRDVAYDMEVKLLSAKYEREKRLVEAKVRELAGYEQLKLENHDMVARNRELLKENEKLKL